MGVLKAAALQNSLAVVAAVLLATMFALSGDGKGRAVAAVVTGTFALIAWILRGVTLDGALAGAAVAFGFFRFGGWHLFAVLLAVFAITWMATAIAATDKGHHGRNACQVMANLAVPCIALLLSSNGGFTLVIAALAELSADTISSELGERFGGRVRLITNLRPVKAGTNGGISMSGTLYGMTAAYVISAIAFFLGIRGAMGTAAAAGIAGMFVDSLLGATLEARRRLNNEAVNLLGTASAAGIAWVFMRLTA